MKKVLGILGVALLSMLLGLSIGWAQREEVSLVSTYPATLVGE